MNNEEIRQFERRLSEKNWTAWREFDGRKRERVKQLMRRGFDIRTAMYVVRTDSF